MVSEKKRKQVYFLICCVLLLVLINYSFIDRAIENFFEDLNYGNFGNAREVFVERVIDGDTLVVNGSSIRLMGINSPERGERLYQEAKEFLEGWTLNKPVLLESFGKDKYYRELGYVFSRGKNIDVESVRAGFSNIYILDDRTYESELRDAWLECLDSNVNLCERSSDACGNCVNIFEFSEKQQRIVLKNSCSFDCDLDGWSLKDEGRKKFIFEDFVLRAGKEVEIRVLEGINSESVLFWEGEDYVLTRTGDSLFLRDFEDRLVDWESY